MSYSTERIILKLQEIIERVETLKGLTNLGLLKIRFSSVNNSDPKPLTRVEAVTAFLEDAKDTPQCEATIKAYNEYSSEELEFYSIYLDFKLKQLCETFNSPRVLGKLLSVKGVFERAHESGEWSAAFKQLRMLFDAIHDAIQNGSSFYKRRVEKETIERLSIDLEELENQVEALWGKFFLYGFIKS